MREEQLSHSAPSPARKAMELNLNNDDTNRAFIQAITDAMRLTGCSQLLLHESAKICVAVVEGIVDYGTFFLPNTLDHIPDDKILGWLKAQLGNPLIAELYGVSFEVFFTEIGRTFKSPYRYASLNIQFPPGIILQKFIFD